MRKINILITEEQEKALNKKALLRGKSKSELIRIAIDQNLQMHLQMNWKRKIMKSAGIWNENKNFQDFNEIRNSLDR